MNFMHVLGWITNEWIYRDYMWEVGISVLRDNKTAEFIKLFIGILIKRDFFHSYLLYLEDFLLDIQKFMKI